MSFGLIGTFGSSPLCGIAPGRKILPFRRAAFGGDDVPHVRQLRLDVADLGDEFRPDEQHRRLAVADDEGDLGPGEPPVHRRHHHVGLHRAHQQLEIDVAVLAEIGDAVARLDAERDQRVGDAVGLDVELGESWSGVPRIHRRGVAAVLARSRTMSARFVSCCEADMSLPWRLVFVARSLASSRAKDNTEAAFPGRSAARPGSRFARLRRCAAEPRPICLELAVMVWTAPYGISVPE